MLETPGPLKAWLPWSAASRKKLRLEQHVTEETLATPIGVLGKKSHVEGVKGG